MGSLYFPKKGYNGKPLSQQDVDTLLFLDQTLIFGNHLNIRLPKNLKIIANQILSATKIPRIFRIQIKVITEKKECLFKIFTLNPNYKSIFNEK